MIVISKNTEMILSNDMEHIRDEAEHQYCHYIAFSQILLDRSYWIDFLIDSLNSFANSDAAKLYICADNDVFFVIPKMTEKPFQILVHDLTKAMKYPALPKFCGVFDLKRDWHKLEIICDKKMESYMAAIAKKNKLKQQNIRLNATLIENLSERRMQSGVQSILVVDDDQLSRTLSKSLLDKHYHMNFSETGYDAISTYVSKAPDVVFLDIGLPDMNGHEVLEHILKIDQDAYVVMFSGRQDEANVRRAIAIGARGYVVKPFSKNKLIDYIEKSPFIRAKCHVE
jgi:two-component system chemotaxis response regulator CheY